MNMIMFFFFVNLFFFFFGQKAIPGQPGAAGASAKSSDPGPTGNIDKKQTTNKEPSLWPKYFSMFSRLMIRLQCKTEWASYWDSGDAALHAEAFCVSRLLQSGGSFHLRRLKMLFLLELLSAVLRPMSSRAFSSSSCCCRLLSDFPSSDLLRRSEAEAGFRRSFSFIIYQIRKKKKQQHNHNWW